jgi:hypothetical protein
MSLQDCIDLRLQQWKQCPENSQLLIENQNKKKGSLEVDNKYLHPNSFREYTLHNNMSSIVNAIAVEHEKKNSLLKVNQDFDSPDQEE